MRMPPRLAPLIDEGIIDRVLRPLMSGKEAQVYLVETDDQLRVAKVYKEATERTFRNRASYTEGRAVRSSRDARAMKKRSRHGREQDEAAWKAAEADVIYRLDYAGVRVPKPYAFIDGVLVMECITGPDGGPAPRLAECSLEPEYALEVMTRLMREVARMLSADIVHGDLSAYNVLLEDDGPVVIDFPQAIDATSNNNARTILLRDVANITSHLAPNVPRSQLRFGYEMWAAYEAGELQPDMPLTGRFDLPDHEVDADLLLQQMLEVEEDEAIASDERDEPFSLGSRARITRPAKPAGGQSGNGSAKKRGTAKGTSSPRAVIVKKGELPPAGEAATPKKKRRRRRRRGDRKSVV